MSEFPGIPCIHTNLAEAGRFSSEMKFYFNFPSRCCHNEEIMANLIEEEILDFLFYLFLPSQSRSHL